MNALAGRDVAIISPIPGTTRDLIEVFLDLRGYPVLLVDTAGIRDSLDPIEQEGVARARRRAKGADLVLWLNDAAGGDGAEPGNADLGGADQDGPCRDGRAGVWRSGARDLGENGRGHRPFA